MSVACLAIGVEPKSKTLTRGRLVCARAVKTADSITAEDKNQPRNWRLLGVRRLVGALVPKRCQGTALQGGALKTRTLFTRTTMIELVNFGLHFRRETNAMQLVRVLQSLHHITDLTDLSNLW